MKLELFLAKISKISYYSNIESLNSLWNITREFNILGKEFGVTYNNHYYFDEKHIEGYLIEYDDFNVLVYRGTVKIDDWVYNLNYIPINSMIGTIHKGYHDSLKFIWNNYLSQKEILNILMSKKLYITGHSMGGTLGILSAYLFRALNVLERKDMIVYTFGSPKAFMEPKTAYYRMIKYSLDNSLKKSIFNIVNPGDIIPKLPLNNMEDVGTTIILKNKIINKPKNFLDKLRVYLGYILKKDFKVFFEQHRIDTYIKNLK